MRSSAKLALVFLLAFGAAAQPHPDTTRAFQRYADAVEARIAQDRNTSHFVRLSANAHTKVFAAAKSLGVQPAVVIPGGQVQHWLGARFVPRMTVARALPILQDYDNRKREMAPAIIESRTLAHTGDSFQVWLRLQQKEIIAAVFDLTLQIRYRMPGSGRLEIQSRSESIEEVPAADSPRGASSKNRGLLWALNHYWRFEERDDGLYIECEALVLARQTPALLRWVADPFVARAARRTLDGTLDDTVRMLQRER